MKPDEAASGPTPVWSTHGARSPCAWGAANVSVTQSRQVEHAAGELDEPAAAQAPVGLHPETGTGDDQSSVPSTPKARSAFGMNSDGAVPGGAVARRVAVEFLDVRLVRGGEEDALAVGEERPGRELRVQVLEAARVQLVAELRVGGRAHEERVPGGRPRA